MEVWHTCRHWQRWQCQGVAVPVALLLSIMTTRKKGSVVGEISARAEAMRPLIGFLEHEVQPMIVLDPDYNIVAANAAYQRQFAGDGKQYVGRKCYQVSHGYEVPCDKAGEHCPMQKARETLGSDRVLHVHHTPRGPEHVDVELRPIMGSDGAIMAFVERLATVKSASARASAGGLVGRSPAFNVAVEQLQRVAPSALPVLLQGESGTGKEVFARALHDASDRAAGPFVVVDCSGLSEALFESELFGYEKGAFTGAMARKPGLVETAQHGTLFLDEIGDVPLTMQVKLLRLIESRTFRRVGGLETHSADFRLVAATHKPLQQMVAQGTFRQDLLYRINAFPIHLPSLRERPDDIPLLAQSLLRRAVPQAHSLRIDGEALSRLCAYGWPGNIRELRNALERAMLFADDEVIRAKDLPPELRELQGRSVQLSVVQTSPLHRGRPAVMPDDAELRRLAREFAGTRKALAAHIGCSERTLYRRLSALGLA